MRDVNFNGKYLKNYSFKFNVQHSVVGKIAIRNESLICNLRKEYRQKMKQ